MTYKQLEQIMDESGRFYELVKNHIFQNDLNVDIAACRIIMRQRYPMEMLFVEDRFVWNFSKTSG